MHIGIRRLGRRHLVFRNRQNKVHAQMLAIPKHGLSRIEAAVGDVMHPLQFHGDSLER